jgi:SAM-dependent methyltransferase
MKQDLLEVLRCPNCAGDLSLEAAKENGNRVESGALRCRTCAASYPIVNYVPRFVAAENYANNFGFQWNRFRFTQLDSHTGTTITRDRFVESTGWSPADLSGKRVLDVGCGAGRFAEIALEFGANLIALDYSSAVDACWQNNRRFPDLTVVRGDIYRLPFAPGSFDYVYCLGVLQHTPDVARAFQALPAQLRYGGRLAVDVYPKLLRNVLSSKYWVRPLTKRMNQLRLYRLVERAVPVLLPASVALGRTPVLGRKLRHLIPVSNYEGVFPLSREQLHQWAVLDTFDMLAPAYDQPQTAVTVRQWFAEAGMYDVEVFRKGHLIGRGRR